jgi:DNA-binding CsgD family transcriptional regulator
MMADAHDQLPLAAVPHPTRSPGSADARDANDQTTDFVPSDGPHDAQAMLEQLGDRLFLRALQFLAGGVVFGMVFLPVRGRTAPLDIATAAVLTGLVTAALAFRGPLLASLRRRPSLALLFGLAPLAAVTLDGGFDSVWTPLVAITVGVPATLGLPWMSLGCALLTGIGQAGAAWLNQGNRATDILVETAMFSAVGTVAVGVGISLVVATLATFLHRRPQVLAQLHDGGLLLEPPAARPDRAPGQPQLERAPRTPLSTAELRVVTLLSSGRAPKQVAAELGVSVATVRTHLKVAKRKTHARTLTELVGLFIVEDGSL